MQKNKIKQPFKFKKCFGVFFTYRFLKCENAKRHECEWIKTLNQLLQNSAVVHLFIYLVY